MTREDPVLGQKTAIIFVADRNFLVPSILAMLQISRQKDTMSVADLFLFTTDLDDTDFRTITDLVTTHGITTIRLDLDKVLSEQETLSFRKTHISISALGRFFTGSCIDSKYENILYIDGDVQVIGSIFDLANADIPDDKILGVIDKQFLKAKERDKSGEKTREYLKKLGILHEADYFNSGVLAAKRETWINLCKEAFDYFVKHSEDCMFHDQSALNAVSVGRRLPMSPKYNFTTMFAENNLLNIVKPSIIHFTGAEKPWFSKARPWQGRFMASYAELLKQFPQLEAFYSLGEYFHSSGQSGLNKIDRHANRMWFLTRILTPWRVILRRRKLLNYLKTTRFFI